MTNVIRITRHHENRVVVLAAKLLEMARRGEVKGMMYVIAGKRGEHAGMVGCYRDDPEQALNVAHKAMGRLYSYTVHKRIDPMTATDFMV